MDANERIQEAQHSILKELEACEMAVGDLYTMYAVRLPEMHAFWSGLAQEERGHALLLNSLHRLLDRGYLFQDLGRFDVKTFRDYVAHVQMQFGTNDAGITPERAVATALSCEKALVESQFFRVVTSDAPEFRQIADHLDKASQLHIKLIEQTLFRIRAAATSGGASAPPTA